MKIRLVGAELFHEDGRTELIAAFRNFANAPDYSVLTAASIVNPRYEICE